MRTTILSLLCLLALTVHADQKALVIVDATNAGGNNKPVFAQRWYVFHDKDMPTIAAAIKKLAGTTAIGTNSDFDAATKALKEAAPGSDNRVFLNQGDTFRIIILSRTDQFLPLTEITEEARKTRFVQDLGTLVKLAVAIKDKGLKEKDVLYLITDKDGGTDGVHPRSTISITVKTKALTSKPAVATPAVATPGAPAAGTTPAITAPDTTSAPGTPSATAAAPKDEPIPPFESTMTPDITVNPTLINGPTEHAFLSADVPITKASDARTCLPRHERIGGMGSW
jgi:hypothetical protein